MVRRKKATDAGWPIQLSNFEDVEDMIIASNRIVMLNAEVDNYAAKSMVTRLTYLHLLNHDPIKVILNSVGGDVYDGLYMHDTITSIVKEGTPVITEARGLAASMCTIILQAGSTRTSTENTRFLIHEVSSLIVAGKTSEIEDEAVELRKLNNQLRGILAKKSHKSPEEIEKMWARRDVWLSAKEALTFGLVDKLV